MSAGFRYSPIARCPGCGARIHPMLIGDIMAHAEASGIPVRFGCAACGALLEWRPARMRGQAERRAGAR